MSALSVVVTEREMIHNCVRIQQVFAKRIHEDSMAIFNSEKKGPKAEQAREWLALNPDTATVDDVRRVMRNPHWTALQCGECDAEVKKAIEIDMDGPYFVCQSCLLNAAKRLA